MNPRRWAIALLVALSLALAAGLTWTAGFLYWHFTLTAAFRDLEDGMEQMEPGKADSYIELKVPGITISDAGCRALPYLVDALDPSRKRFLLHWCSQRLPCGQELTIHTTETPAEAESKCRKIREWWKLHRSEYHDSWRWWTDECRSEIPGN